MPGKHSSHTPERYQEILEAFRQCGGVNFFEVSRRTGMDRASVKRLWVEGWPNEGFRPIQAVYADYVQANPAILDVGQNDPAPGQNAPIEEEAGQNAPTTGQNSPSEGQNTPTQGQDSPHDGVTIREVTIHDNTLRDTTCIVASPAAGAAGACAGTGLAGDPPGMVRQPTHAPNVLHSGAVVHLGLTEKQHKAREKEQDLVLLAANNLIGLSSATTTAVSNVVNRLNKLIEEAGEQPQFTDPIAMGVLMKDLKELSKTALEQTGMLLKLMEASRLNVGDGPQQKGPVATPPTEGVRKVESVERTLGHMVTLARMASNVQRGQRVARHYRDIEPSSVSPATPTLAELEDSDT